MDLFQIVLFAALIIGILLILISMFLFSRENRNVNVDYLERGNTIKAIESSINELDKTMEEFDNLSKSAFEELEEKYQEILFLYNLLNDMKQEIASIYYHDDVKKETKQRRMIDKDDTLSMAKTMGSRKYSNPKASEIMELMNQGDSISEIAKKLNIGKGEVRLITELAKGSLS